MAFYLLASPKARRGSPSRHMRSLSSCTLVTFKINYWTKPGENVSVCGSEEGLGKWKPVKALRMKWDERNDGTWEAAVVLPNDGRVVLYKYVITDERGNPLRWETRSDRMFTCRGGQLFRVDSWDSLQLIKESWKAPHLNFAPTPDYKFLSLEQLFATDVPSYQVLRSCLVQQGWFVEESGVHRLLHSVSKILVQEKNIVEVSSPAIIIGDIHGHFSELLQLFDRENLPDHPECTDLKYIFLGDYVDRGSQSLEVVLFLYCLKLNFPQNFFLLRGNHETKLVNEQYDFKQQCVRKYGVDLYYKLEKSFQCLPISAILTLNNSQKNKFLCVHGGFGPSINTLTDIIKIFRFCEPPMTGALCDLLWADPAENESNDSQEIATDSPEANAKQVCEETNVVKETGQQVCEETNVVKDTVPEILVVDDNKPLLEICNENNTTLDNVVDEIMQDTTDIEDPENEKNDSPHNTRPPSPENQKQTSEVLSQVNDASHKHYVPSIQVTESEKPPPPSIQINVSQNSHASIVKENSATLQSTSPDSLQQKRKKISLPSLLNYRHQQMGFHFNTNRQCSYFYSLEAVKNFTSTNDLTSIIRAHSYVPKGVACHFVSDLSTNSAMPDTWKTFANPIDDAEWQKAHPLVISLFSAPDYHEDEKNIGAYLKFDRNNSLSLQKLTKGPPSPTTKTQNK